MLELKGFEVGYAVLFDHSTEVEVRVAAIKKEDKRT